MKWIAQTLWDLLKIDEPVGVAPRQPTQPKPARRRGIHERYAQLVADMKAVHGFRVRKWRNSSSGVAWMVHYRDGTTTRLIEAPYPRGPMSCAIFLHEIGHHAIGFRRYRPRCLEEYHAWRWALDAMRERRFNVTDAVERRVAESLQYAVSKARRRGLRRLPAELAPYA